MYFNLHEPSTLTTDQYFRFRMSLMVIWCTTWHKWRSSRTVSSNAFLLHSNTLISGYIEFIAILVLIIATRFEWRGRTFFQLGISCVCLGHQKTSRVTHQRQTFIYFHTRCVRINFQCVQTRTRCFRHERLRQFVVRNGGHEVIWWTPSSHAEESPYSLIWDIFRIQ